MRVLYDYITGKSVIGWRQGPQPVLSQEEAQWAGEMAKVSRSVKENLNKDQRPNSFPYNRPGKDWWYGFLAQKLTMRSWNTTEPQLEMLRHWYAVSSYPWCEDASRIWNCDECGFPLCPKS